MYEVRIDICAAARLVAKPTDVLAELEPPFVSTSTATTPAIVQKNIDTAKQNWYENAADHPFLNQIDEIAMVFIVNGPGAITAIRTVDGKGIDIGRAFKWVNRSANIADSRPRMQVRWYGENVKAIRKAVWLHLANTGQFGSVRGEWVYGCNDYDVESLLECKPNHGTTPEKAKAMILGDAPVIAAKNPLRKQAIEVAQLFVRAGAIPIDQSFEALFKSSKADQQKAAE